MKKISVLLLSMLLTIINVAAQDSLQIPQSLKSQTIVTVDSSDFSAEDFLWILSSSNTKNQLDLFLNDTATREDTIAFYKNQLVKYAELKMKIVEAELLQLDSTKTFKDEFFKHVKTTAHDFIYKDADKKIDDFVKLEYDRLHWDYEVAHIFVKSNIYDSPASKELAAKKVEQIQSELNAGASFETCVQKYSDDKLSKDFNGNVGFITAMVSPYEYENALYNAEVGEITKARTSEGWYFIKVLQKRPTKGAVDAAIILIYPQTDNKDDWDSAKITIDTIYSQLQNGAPFDSLSSIYNLNERLRDNNGILGLIDNGMPYEKILKETLFNLENDGDFSQPIKLPYGYAIVKRRWLLPLPGIEAYQSGYEKRIENDKSRNTVIPSYYEEQMKKNLNFKFYENELENCMRYIDASILLGKWTAPKLDDDVTLFEIAGEKYGRNDFFQYLQVIQKHRLQDVHEKDMLVRIRFADYVTRRLEFASMRNLEKNDKDFQYTMQEYHDGMIVYELMKQEVFQESVRDSVGMKFYFNQHRENYMTAERTVSAWIYIKNPKLHDKVLEMLYEQQDWYYWHDNKTKYAEKMEHYKNIGSPQLYILDVINSKKAKSIDVDTKEPLISPNDVILKMCGPEEAPRECIMPNKIADFGDSLHVVYYNLASRQLTYEEAKDQLLIDYQHELEERWIKSMYRRHTVEIDYSLLNQLMQYIK